MKKVLLIIMMIGIVGLGCVPTATPATPATNPIQELQTWRTTLDTWKATVADPAIAKINAQVAGANYQPQIDSAKATIAELQKQITDLTTRVTTTENSIKTLGTVASTQPVGQTGQTGQGSIPQFTPGSLTGAIQTSPNGSVEQQLNWSTQGNLLYAGPGGSNQLYYTQRFINHNTAQMFVTPKIYLGLGSGQNYASTPQTITAITFNIQGGSGGFYSPVPVQATYSATNATQNMQITGGPGVVYYLANPPLGSASAYSLSITPYYQYYKGLPLGPGQYMDVNVQVYGLICTPGATWTVTPQFDASL